MNEAGEDWNLVELARGGDEAAYGMLIERYQNPVHSFIFRSVGNEETAQDLTQETFVRAWFALAKVRATGRFSTWLFQIAVNLCRDHVKSKATRQEHLTEPMTTGTREDGTTIERNFPHAAMAPDESAAQAEAVARLDVEIRALPDSLREPFLLGAVEGYTQKEVSDALGISPKSVETRIYRARKFLMERLSRLKG